MVVLESLEIMYMVVLIGIGEEAEGRIGSKGRSILDSLDRRPS